MIFQVHAPRNQSLVDAISRLSMKSEGPAEAALLAAFHETVVIAKAAHGCGHCEHEESDGALVRYCAGCSQKLAAALP